jgi:hypothetical protein
MSDYEKAISSVIDEKFGYSYIRYSSPLQGLGTSDDRQTAITEDICKKHGIKLIDAIKDKGVSAKDGDNLEANFASLARIIKRGEYVIVEEWSRITRAGKRSMVNAIGSIIDRGGKVLVAMGEDNEPVEINDKNFESDRIWNEISAGGGAVKKENDRLTRKKREAWAFKKQALARGEKVRIQVVPSWLKNTPKDFEPVDYIRDEAKIETINSIFNLCKTGMGLKRLHKHLNRNNVPSIHNNGKAHGKKGRSWTIGTVWRLLRDKRVIGLCSVVTPPAKVYPVIVDETLFWEVQRILDSRSNYQYSGKGIKAVNLFSGLAKCSTCGQNLIIVFNYKQERGIIRYLACRMSRLGKCEATSWVNLEHLEYSFTQILGRMDLIHDLISKKENKEPSRIPMLQRQLNQCAIQRQRLYDIIKRLEEPPLDIHTQIQQSVKEEKDILAEIDKENARLLGSQPVKEALQTYREKFATKCNDPENRMQIREILRTIIEKLIIDTKQKTYNVWFKNVETPIEVRLNKDGCEINGMQFPYPNVRKYVAHNKGKHFIGGHYV